MDRKTGKKPVMGVFLPTSGVAIVDIITEAAPLGYFYSSLH